ncbi:hypothetical protein ACFWDG_04490 [Peribacillus sp. NPDC060186]
MRILIPIGSIMLTNDESYLSTIIDSSTNEILAYNVSSRMTLANQKTKGYFHRIIYMQGHIPYSVNQTHY